MILHAWTSLSSVVLQLSYIDGDGLVKFLTLSDPSFSAYFVKWLAIYFSVLLCRSVWLL